jgi:hypothetical protein
MRRVRIVALSACALLLPAVPANAVGAGSAATPNLQITYSIAAIQFDGPECVRVPVTVDYAKVGAAYDDISGRVSFDIRYPGSSSTNSPSVYIGYFDPQSARENTDFTFCPFEFAPGIGSMQVTGSVRSDVFGSPEIETPLPPSALTVTQNPTTMSPVKVKKERGYYALSGSVTAQTVTKGVIGARGKITVQLKKKGSKRWISGTTTYPDSFGNWSTFSLAISSRNYPKGTQYRVIHSDCNWCSDASRTGKLP